MSLDFAYVLRQWGSDIDELRVYSRPDADSAWQMVAEYTAAVTTWTPATVIIPGAVYQVAFEYTDNYGYGLGIDEVVFTPMSGDFCYAVTDLTVTNITSTSVSLAWNDNNNDGATYTIYDMSDSSVIASDISTTDYEINGLTSSTSYTFGVVANCSSTSASNVVTIGATTHCAAGACQITIVGNDSWGDGWNGNAINVIQDGITIGSFTLASGSTFTETFTVCGSSPVNFQWVTGSYASETSFSILDGGNQTVYSASGSDMVNDSVFFTMNEPCPSCLPVANLTVTEATTSSVTLSWIGSAASYGIYNGTTFVENVTTNSYTFTGLDAGTTYTFAVQAICSDTDFSTLTTINVITECSDVTTLPYLEDFEGGFGCWSTVNGSSDGMPWNIINNANYAHSGTKAAVSFSYYDEAMHANAWLISPKFVLPAVTNDSLTLTWWYRVNSNYPNDLYDVKISTTTNDTAAFTTTLLSVTPSGVIGYVHNMVNLTPYAGQEVYIAFHHHDSYDQDYLLIDDIELYEGSYVPPTVDTLTVTIAVNDPTMGTTTPVPGTYQYITGDTVFLSAIANPGYHFVGWAWAHGTEVDTLGAIYMSFNFLANDLMAFGDMTFTAIFDLGGNTSSVSYSVNDINMGTTIPAPGVYTLNVGDNIQATAVPNAGYQLSMWLFDLYLGGVLIATDTISSDDEDFANPMTFGTVSQTLIDYGATFGVTAIFEAGGTQTQYTVTLNTADATMGTVSPAGATLVNAGNTFTATATANDGYQFVAWMDGNTQVSQDNPYTFTVNGDITLTATFASTATPCDVPTGLTVGNITHESIAISWDANANVNSWNIQYRPVGGSYSSASSNTNSYTITGLAPETTYEIQVQAVCGDGQTSDWSAAVTGTTGTGINEHLLNSIVLFPNPAKEYINVQCTMYNVQLVEVIDVYGKLINTINVIDTPAQINVSNLASGMYFVRVTTEQGVATKSFVKK